MDHKSEAVMEQTRNITERRHYLTDDYYEYLRTVLLKPNGAG